MGQCFMCRELFDWSMLETYHELPHCPKCKSMVMTKIKKQEELLKQRPEPEEGTFDKADEKFVPTIKVSKSRGKKGK